MALPSRLPDAVTLLPSASKDLERILKKNRQEFFRVWDGLNKKKLKSLDAFQIDSGRYRIVYSRQDAQYVIWAIFAKPDQRDYFRRLRS